MQWTTYLSQIRGDAGGVSGELDPEILANLPEDKKEQLRRLQEETSKPFSMEANKVEKDSRSRYKFSKVYVMVVVSVHYHTDIDMHTYT